VPIKRFGYKSGLLREQSAQQGAGAGQERRQAHAILDLPGLLRKLRDRLEELAKRIGLRVVAGQRAGRQRIGSRCALLFELSTLLLQAGALIYQLHALLIIALLDELLALLHQLLTLLNQVLADLALLRLLAVVVVMMMMVVMMRTESCLKIARRLRPLQAERIHGADLKAALKVYRGQTHRCLLRSFSLMVQSFAKQATAPTLDSILDRLMSAAKKII
jgi:hypothetical protein